MKLLTVVEFTGDEILNEVESIVCTENHEIDDYTNELFNRIDAGAIVNGYCEGHNEIVCLVESLSDTLKSKLTGEGKYIIISRSNDLFVRFNSYEELKYLIDIGDY